MSKVQQLKSELRASADYEKVKRLQRFFKTGKGEYAEGDKLLGVSVPEQRKIARKYQDLPLNELAFLLKSKYHEDRLTALIILVSQFQKGDAETQKAIYELYLKNTMFINNWDLVDTSAEFIVGPMLENKDKSMLIELANSESLWERRIAILATFHYIKNGKPDWTLKIAKILLQDQHDLIQKAVGWMLREVGKRCSLQVEEAFLEKHYKEMPRTTLRYAIERFEEQKRLEWLKK